MNTFKNEVAHYVKQVMHQAFETAADAKRGFAYIEETEETRLWIADELREVAYCIKETLKCYMNDEKDLDDLEEVIAYLDGDDIQYSSCEYENFINFIERLEEREQEAREKFFKDSVDVEIRPVLEVLPDADTHIDE